MFVYSYCKATSGGGGGSGVGSGSGGGGSGGSGGGYSGVVKSGVTVLRGLVTLFVLLLTITSASAMTDPSMEQQVIVEVDGVEGESASVPCDLFATDVKDKVTLILWYKDDAKDPIYSYDARLTVFASEKHHLKELNLKGRIMFTPSPRKPIPHKLTIASLSASDAGLYSCRVDFLRAQSTTRSARLRVVSPVQSLIITDAGGEPVPPTISPIPEGGTLNLTCTAHGGRPQPKVSWWLSESIIDDSYSGVAGGRDGGEGSIVSNTLIINPLTRAHVLSVLTCKAATAPIAVTTTTVTIDMYLRPLTVDITGAAVGGSVRAGDVLDLTCTAIGSKPPPTMYWYKGATEILKQDTHRKDVAGVGGVSHIRVTVKRRDNGARITCRAKNELLPLHTIQDHLVINVTYPPEVELRVGAPIEGTVIKEERNLYLTCNIDANPPPHKLVFLHQDREVRQDKSERVIVNGNNLVLNKIRRSQAGEYSCRATNSEGTGRSAPLNITVLYAPVCLEESDVWGELGSTVLARCRVLASPVSPIHFSWVWKTPSYSRRVIPSLVTSTGTTSTVNFTVPRDNVTEEGIGAAAADLGVLQCWAENSVGRQEKPCKVAVRKPAPPSPPINCTLTESGPEVVTVNCQPGDSRSIPERYLLQVCGAKNRKLCHNVSSSVPRFVVRGLTYGRDYEVYVSSSTGYGRSPFRLVEAFTFKTAENRMGSETSPPSLYTIIIFVGGVGGVIILIIIIIALIRLRMRRSTHKCTRRPLTSTTSELLERSEAAAAADGADNKRGSEGKSVTASSSSDNHINKTSTGGGGGGGEGVARETGGRGGGGREAVPLQPIIRQPSRPIIKENSSRSENGKSSQGRTVLFVEPPKPAQGILVNKNEVPRTSHEALYHPSSSSTRRSLKGPNGDVGLHGYSSRGSYPETLHTLHVSRGFDGYERERDVHVYRDREREPPLTRYRSVSDDRGYGSDLLAPQYLSHSATSLGRDGPYGSPRGLFRMPGTSPPYRDRDRDRDLPPRRELPKRELPRDRDHPRDIRDHRDPRELPRDPRERDHIRDHPRDHPRDRDLHHPRDRDHGVSFPSRSMSHEYDAMLTRSPPSCMKKSPSVSASVGRYYEPPSRRQDGTVYRSLPRPGKTRDPEEDTLHKYRSLDRRFDLPFSGSLQRVQPEEVDEGGERHPPRRYSGSSRMRFGDEKHFHVYHEKEKTKPHEGLDDMDESFV